MFDIIARNKDMLINESIEVRLILSSWLLDFGWLCLVEEDINKSVILWEASFIETHKIVYSLINYQKVLD